MVLRVAVKVLVVMMVVVVFWWRCGGGDGDDHGHGVVWSDGAGGVSLGNLSWHVVITTASISTPLNRHHY